MATAEYQRAWKAKNRERHLANSRSYYQRVRKYEPRIKRNDPDARCGLCEIRLISTFGGKGRKKYCDDCVAHYGERLLKLYQRRKYQKSRGYPVEPIDVKHL